MAPILKILAVLTTPPLVLRPPVAVGLGLVLVKLESWELAELMREEREEMELESVGDDTEVVFVGGIEEPLKVEVGGEVDVTGGREGIEVGVSMQTSEGPALTVITGVSLPCPTESARTITTFVPAGIVTMPQVNEVPLMFVKAAATGPAALPVWKD